MTLPCPRLRDGPRTLVVAGLSVRPLAESARQGGWRVIALDLFGDVDTRRASAQWAAIGDAATTTIACARLQEALDRLACCPGMDGWVAGSGFEGAPRLLDAGSPALPRLGTSSAHVARVRDPAAFFGALDRLGLAHPPTSLLAPHEPAGWLAKRAGGCGGVHIRGAAGTPRSSDTYYQRIQPGVPMSALFLADGRGFRLVALNRLIVRPLDDRPHVYVGAVGPVTDRALEGTIEQALAALVPEFGLRGLASLDFIADDAAGVHLLEINPRPSATMQLHAHAWPRGLMHAHVLASRGRLPATPPRHGDGVRGHATVFADRAACISTASADALAHAGHHHDLPAAGSRFARGDPVCTVSAGAAGFEEAMRRLTRRAGGVLRCLSTVAPAAFEEFTA
jgi:predicted ATP-grasp superfamily ATP-dependent carboligase